ncbi:hypothetical protein J9332_44520, partial [Aquimarina celericrescens]|nr:hypothetical protein [Aquimarina celericrescens]
IGATHRQDRLNSVFELTEENDNRLRPDGFQNLTEYRVTDIYAKGKYLYKVGDQLNITGNLEAHQLLNTLQNSNEVKQQQD